MELCILVLDETEDYVLMERSECTSGYFYLTTKVNENDNHFDVAYNILKERAGIEKEQVDLKFMKSENITRHDGSMRNTCILCGTLKYDSKIDNSKLKWVYLSNTYYILKECGGDGRAYIYMVDMMQYLHNIKNKEGII